MKKQIYVEHHQNQSVVERAVFSELEDAKQKVISMVASGTKQENIICYVVEDLKFNIIRKIDLEWCADAESN